MTQHEKVVLDRDDLRRTLMRIAHEIVEKNPGEDGLGLVGIHTRGAVLASRLHALVGELTGSQIPLGDLDISSTATTSTPACPAGSRSCMRLTSTSTSTGARSCSSTTCCSPDERSAPRSRRCSTTGARSGCSSRCSIDRGHRELPIRPDYVGKNLPTSRRERVNVAVEELDGSDAVTIGAAEDRTAVGAQSEEEEAS